MKDKSSLLVAADSCLEEMASGFQRRDPEPYSRMERLQWPFHSTLDRSYTDFRRPTISLAEFPHKKPLQRRE